MKNFLLAIVTVLITCFCFVGNVIANDEILINDATELELLKPNDDSEMNMSMLCLPGPRIVIDIRLGRKRSDCEGLWPICHLSICGWQVFKSPNNIKGECYIENDNLCLTFSEQDIIASKNEELKKNLLNYRSVLLGQDITISEDLILKLGLKPHAVIDGSVTYQIVKVKGTITINIPLKNIH